MGSLLSTLVLTLIVAAGAAAFTGERYMASEYAIMALEDDLERAPAGKLRLKPRGRIADLSARSPGLWYLARGPGGDLVGGQPPGDARGAFQIFARALPWERPTVNLRLGPAPETGHASLDVVDGPGGPVLVMVGGVDPESVGFGILGFYLVASALTVLVPVAVVTGVLVLLIVTPLVLRGLRPLSAAASALDGRDLARRLPEEGVMSELLPLVRALNGALDRLEQAFEARRRFMADVAHEFRTPLAVMTLQADDLPEGAPKANLQRGVFRMSQMVGQMLDSERLGTPGRPFETVDLVALARGAAADIAPLAMDAGHAVEFAADAERTLVEGDPHALKRAVTNLLGNAVAHAGGAGPIRVWVGPGAVVEVADEGCGVPEAARERVFEPFHRERWDRDGCGLGLHLVREIMHAHGGRAELSSGPPGAVFRLVFPSTRALTPESERP